MKLTDRDYLLTVTWRDARGCFTKELRGDMEFLLRNIGYLAASELLEWHDIACIQQVVKEMPVGSTRIVNDILLELDFVDRLANPKVLRFERQQIMRRAA